MTRDIDLLVRDSDRSAWDSLITSLGYTPHQIARAFHMYNPTVRGGLPVDLMVVDLAALEYADMLARYATPAVRDEIFRRLAGPESSDS